MNSEVIRDHSYIIRKWVDKVWGCHQPTPHGRAHPERADCYRANFTSCSSIAIQKQNDSSKSGKVRISSMFVWNAYRGRGGWRGRKRRGRPDRAERGRRPGGGLGGSGASASGNSGGIRPRPGQLSVGGAPACPAPRTLRRGVETAPRESSRKFTPWVFLLLFRCLNADFLDEKNGIPNFLDQPCCINCLSMKS